jgi:hypothetical protein
MRQAGCKPGYQTHLPNQGGRKKMKMFISVHESGKFIHRDHQDLLGQGGWLLTDDPAQALCVEQIDRLNSDGKHAPFEKVRAYFVADTNAWPATEEDYVRAVEHARSNRTTLESLPCPRAEKITIVAGFVPPVPARWPTLA